MKRHVLLCLALSLMSGCYGASGSSFEGHLVPVSGGITVDGVPAGGVQLTFIPSGETQGTGGFATSTELGTYTVMHRTGKSGLEAGTYKILCSLVTKPDGAPVGPDEDAAIVGREQLPVSYQSAESSRLEVTVPAQGLEHNIEIISRPK